MKKWTVGTRIVWRDAGKLYRGVVVEPASNMPDTRAWILLDDDPAYGYLSHISGTVFVNELELEDENNL